MCSPAPLFLLLTLRLLAPRTGGQHLGSGPMAVSRGRWCDPSGAACVCVANTQAVLVMNQPCLSVGIFVLSQRVPSSFRECDIHLPHRPFLELGLVWAGKTQIKHSLGF